MLLFVLILLLASTGWLIYRLETSVMPSQTELAQALNSVSDQLTKAVNEITVAVGNSGNTSPEVDAALTRLQGISQSLDDLNADAPAP
jgi:hypothetical protein